jgi:uncharacterized protein YecE (DUF72 family)
MKYYIGTSGYHYDDWKEKFYPEDLPKKEWLSYYAERFNTLEVNNTFYNVPEKKTLRNWDEQVPASFRFTLKGSRYVTHMKKLKEPGEGMRNFYKAVEPLKDKSRCVLWQLPGNLHFSAEKLKALGEQLSSDYINVVEFRHHSWFTDESMELLEKYKLSFCMISAPDDLPELATKTTNSAYLRFHGKDDWYKHLYTKNELQKWLRKLGGVKPKEVYIYFNNDVGANAIKNAQQLQEMTT